MAVGTGQVTVTKVKHGDKEEASAPTSSFPVPAGGILGADDDDDEVLRPRAGSGSSSRSGLPPIPMPGAAPSTVGGRTEPLLAGKMKERWC